MTTPYGYIFIPSPPLFLPVIHFFAGIMRTRGKRYSLPDALQSERRGQSTVPEDTPSVERNVTPSSPAIADNLVQDVANLVAAISHHLAPQNIAHDPIPSTSSGKTANQGDRRARQTTRTPVNNIDIVNNSDTDSDIALESDNTTTTKHGRPQRSEGRHHKRKRDHSDTDSSDDSVHRHSKKSKKKKKKPKKQQRRRSNKTKRSKKKRAGKRTDSSSQEDTSSESSSSESSSSESNSSSSSSSSSSESTSEDELPTSNFNTNRVRLDLRVPDKLKKKIWRGKYVELGQLLLAARRPGALFEKRKKGKSQAYTIYSILDWISAFHVFTAVYVMKYPEEAASLMHYMHTIMELAHNGGDWLNYDHEFRVARAVNQQEWHNINTDIYVEFRYAKQNKRPQPMPNKKKFQNQSSPKQALPRGVCYRFHSGKECNIASCQYSHVCFECKGPHPIFQCARQGQSNKPFLSQPRKQIRTQPSKQGTSQSGSNANPREPRQV